MISIGAVGGLLRGAGRLAGVLGVTAQGTPVKARKTRLGASMAILLVALLNWAGLPPEVSTALADILAEMAVSAATE